MKLSEVIRKGCEGIGIVLFIIVAFWIGWEAGCGHTRNVISGGCPKGYEETRDGCFLKR